MMSFLLLIRNSEFRFSIQIKSTKKRNIPLLSKKGFLEKFHAELENIALYARNSIFLPASAI
jgi:hypothetical protein